jgi:hypothetical protein
MIEGFEIEQNDKIVLVQTLVQVAGLLALTVNHEPISISLPAEPPRQHDSSVSQGGMKVGDALFHNRIGFAQLSVRVRAVDDLEVVLLFRFRLCHFPTLLFSAV